MILIYFGGTPIIKGTCNRDDTVISKDIFDYKEINTYPLHFLHITVLLSCNLEVLPLYRSSKLTLEMKQPSIMNATQITHLSFIKCSLQKCNEWKSHHQSMDRKKCFVGHVPWEKNWPPWLLTVRSQWPKWSQPAVTEPWPGPWLSGDLAVTELWSYWRCRDWAVTSPWLSCDLCDLTVTELWPLLAVIIGPRSRDHRELTVTIYFLMGC